MKLDTIQAGIVAKQCNLLFVKYFRLIFFDRCTEETSQDLILYQNIISNYANGGPSKTVAAAFNFK
jgi:hypothetical protein